MTNKEKIQQIEDFMDFLEEKCIITSSDTTKTRLNLNTILQDLEILEILKEECQEGIDSYGKGTWGWVEFDLGYEDELDVDGTNKMKKLREWLNHDKQRNDKQRNDKQRNDKQRNNK